MNKIKEKDLEKVNGGEGSDITAHDLYIYNNFIRAVQAKLALYKESYPNLTDAEYKEASKTIFEEVYDTLSAEEKKSVDKFNFSGAVFPL